MQLHDLDVRGGRAGLGEGQPGGPAGGGAAHQVDAGAGEEGGGVGGEGLAGDEDGLGAEVGGQGGEEGGGDEDSGAGAVGRGAALELGEGVVDGRRIENVLERVDVLELRVGVVL